MSQHRDPRTLEQRVTEVLNEPKYQGHPLHAVLEQLWTLHKEHLQKLERVTSISDGFQNLAREREHDLDERFRKQLRRLEKLARISDGYQQMMQDLNAALNDASNRDVLTGLANRRFLVKKLKEESERSDRTGQPYSLAMLDVDHFKAVNDTHGHGAGDQILAEISRTLQAQLREYDLCGRWGGEEFLMVLPATTGETAIQIANRICHSIRQLQVPPDFNNFSVSASIGISLYKPGENFSETIHRADIALLRAKRNGRDQVCLLDANTEQRRSPYP